MVYACKRRIWKAYSRQENKVQPRLSIVFSDNKKRNTFKNDHTASRHEWAGQRQYLEFTVQSGSPILPAQAPKLVQPNLFEHHLNSFTSFLILRRTWWPTPLIPHWKPQARDSQPEALCGDLLVISAKEGWGRGSASGLSAWVKEHDPVLKRSWVE